jgi:hypothetical protein
MFRYASRIHYIEGVLIKREEMTVAKQIWAAMELEALIDPSLGNVDP